MPHTFLAVPTQVLGACADGKAFLTIADSMVFLLRMSTGVDIVNFFKTFQIIIYFLKK